MRFVEQNDAVEIRPRPVEQLLQARCAVMALGAKRRIGEEDDPARHSDGFTKGKSIERLNVDRSEEHTSELQSLMRISYAVFCLKKKKKKKENNRNQNKIRRAETNT